MNQKNVIKKTVRTLCLVVIFSYGNSAWAEFWLPYWYGNGFISHYDPTSIEKVGDEAQVEIMTDRERILFAAQREYKSTTTIEKIHCKNKTFSMLSIQTWSEQMAKGKIVYSNYEPFAVDLEISDGMNAAALYRILCVTARSESNQE